MEHLHAILDTSLSTQAARPCSVGITSELDSIEDDVGVCIKDQFQKAQGKGKLHRIFLAECLRTKK